MDAGTENPEALYYDRAFARRYAESGDLAVEQSDEIRRVAGSGGARRRAQRSTDEKLRRGDRGRDDGARARVRQ